MLKVYSLSFKLMKNAYTGFWNYMTRHQNQAVNWCHFDRLRSNIQLWKQKFPNINPYYAVKCNPHPQIIQTLSTLGYAFDCASQGEIQQILKINPKSQIIFANPIKIPEHLQYAQQHQVNLMTADCPEEIAKIKTFHPKAQVILRIAVDDSQSICKFNSKFGLQVTTNNLQTFFNSFQATDVTCVGVSFHVGSGCQSALSYQDAIEKSRDVFNFAHKIGYPLQILDIGGGFIQKLDLLNQVANTISTQLQTWQLSNNGNYPQQIIAEPGRFLVENVFDLYTTVIGKKQDKDGMRYYINDGTYGSFNCIFFDHVSVFDYEIYRNQELYQSHTDTQKSSVFGQTCDSIDLILKDQQLPILEIGDVIKFKNMGAYTNASATTFNGFPKPLVYVS